MPLCGGKLESGPRPRGARRARKSRGAGEANRTARKTRQRARYGHWPDTKREAPAASREVPGFMARPKRFELLTPRFVVWCSIQLSYGRVLRIAREVFPDEAKPPGTGL